MTENTLDPLPEVGAHFWVIGSVPGCKHFVSRRPRSFRKEQVRSRMRNTEDARGRWQCAPREEAKEFVQDSVTWERSTCGASSGEPWEKSIV